MVSQIKIKRKVNEFVECAAASYIKGFYPTAAAKYAETSVEEVFKYLVDLTKTGELELKWELRCPDFTCGKIIDVSIDRNEALNDTILCPKCGKEFDVNIRDFYPVFMITNQFKEIIREERSKKKVCPLLLLKN
ncbi:MAG: hypothetical protein CW346_11110 [Bacillaceae bacterium]|nr:hypothetical protein [Bacillaceae bacterium]